MIFNSFISRIGVLVLAAIVSFSQCQETFRFLLNGFDEKSVSWMVENPVEKNNSEAKDSKELSDEKEKDGKDWMINFSMVEFNRNEIYFAYFFHNFDFNFFGYFPDVFSPPEV